MLLQELWWQPRSMAKVRGKVAGRGDPSRFDAYLGSRLYRSFRWYGLVAGAAMVVLGVMVVAGV